jgi:hypothetical protein
MTTHAIHALTFDLSIDTYDSDSARYAQWIQSILLPIIDEVIEQQAIEAKIDQHQITRIQKLELDLGEVSAEMPEAEIGRRLRAQLSTALFEQLGLSRQPNALTTKEVDKRENELIQFLRVGHISWEKSGNSRHAHKKLIQEARNSPRFTELFDELSRQPQQLLRLVRQFDHSDLFLLVRQKIRTWSSHQQELCLDWLSLELCLHAEDQSYIENLWLFVLQQNTSHRFSLNELSSTWYQQLGQSTALSLLHYETKLNQAQALTQLGKLGQEECKETVRQLRLQLGIHNPSNANSASKDNVDVIHIPSIIKALEESDFAILRAHWPSVLNLLPQTIRRLHQRHWSSWLQQLDQLSAFELLTVLQPQSRWFLQTLIAQAKAETNADKHRLLIEYALPLALDSLSAKDLVALWEEALQSPQSAGLLQKQLRTFASQDADKASSSIAPSEKNHRDLSQETSASIIHFNASRADIKQAIAQCGIGQCERISSLVDAPTLLRWSSLLLPHLEAFFTEVFRDQPKIAAVLRTSESELSTMVWKTVLAHHQRFISARQMLISILQGYASSREQQQTILVDLQTALPSNSKELRYLIHQVQGPSTTAASASAQTVLSYIDQFQNSSRSERIKLLAKLDHEQQLAIIDAKAPALASVVRELVGHTGLLREWLKSALPHVSSTQELQQKILFHFLIEDTAQRTSVEKSSVLEEVISAIAAATSLSHDSIKTGFKPASSSSIENRLRQVMPNVLVLVQSNGLARVNSPMLGAPHEPLVNPKRSSLALPRLLAEFHDWQRGKVRLQELALDTDELKQIIQWWLNQNSSLPGAFKTRFLEQVLSACEECPSPTRFLEAVLDTMHSRADLDVAELEEILMWELHAQQLATTQGHAQSDSPSHLSASDYDFLLEDAPALKIHSTEAGTAENETAADLAQALDIARLEAQATTSENWVSVKQFIKTLLFAPNATQLDIDDLHRLLKLYGRGAIQESEYAIAFLRSVEMHALKAHSPKQFLHQSLQDLISDQAIDLEELLSRDQGYQDGPSEDARSSTRHLFEELSESFAPGTFLQAAPQSYQAWASFLQQDNVSRYLRLYLGDLILHTQVAASSVLKQQWSAIAQEIDAQLEQATPTLILALLSEVLAFEAQQQGAVLASALTQQFDLAPELITDLTKEASNNSALKSAYQTQQQDVVETQQPVPDAIVQVDSPLPKSWREALPQLLAEAFLAGSLNKLDLVWSELNRFHQQDLLQAQKRYLHHASSRERLIRSESQEKLLDLVSAFSPATKHLLTDVSTACRSMIKIWKLSLSEEQLFTELLSKTYDLLFTAQLAKKQPAQQLLNILQATSFWPQELPAQRRFVRAMYFSLQHSGASLLRESLHALYHQEKVHALLELATVDSQSDSDTGLEHAEHGSISHETLIRTLIEGDSASTIDKPNSLPMNVLELVLDKAIELKLENLSGSQSHTALIDNFIKQAVFLISSELDSNARSILWNTIAQHLSGHISAGDHTVLRQTLATQMQTIRDGLAHQTPTMESDRSTTIAASNSSTDLDRLALLLGGNTPLQHREKLWIQLCVERVTTASDQTLHTLAKLLRDDIAIERLLESIDSVDTEFLFHRLYPALHQHLHALCRAIEATSQLKLYESHGFLSPLALRAIYRAVKRSDTHHSAQSFSQAVLHALRHDHAQQATGKDTEAANFYPRQEDLANYAKQQKLEANRKRLAEEEAKQRALSALKKKARLLGEEEEIPYGESNVLNAGLVIIAPYIQRLFNILELTRDGAFVSNDAAERAVHLLQYVVTAEQATPEYRLALNKLLCGIHGGVPIVAGIEITEHEKTVIEQMLNGVIAHWSALGKTSIAGLRQTFLAREGQLSFVDESWQLRIPSSSFDMLLDRLPWSFAMIKYPWMRAPLHVTWRS